MQLIWFIVVGFFAGLIARAIMPGKQPMGLVMTTLLGIAGSFVGGFLASLFTHTQAGMFHTSGILGSILGALAVLGVYLAVNNHRTRAVV
jgi:uncharacterized membrane protein YeaQ/YmgE (transglycosylase-associated protein family)